MSFKLFFLNLRIETRMYTNMRKKNFVTGCKFFVCLNILTLIIDIACCRSWTVKVINHKRDILFQFFYSIFFIYFFVLIKVTDKCCWTTSAHIIIIIWCKTITQIFIIIIIAIIIFTIVRFQLTLMEFKFFLAMNGCDVGHLLHRWDEEKTTIYTRNINKS